MVVGNFLFLVTLEVWVADQLTVIFHAIFMSTVERKHLKFLHVRQDGTTILLRLEVDLRQDGSHDSSIRTHVVITGRTHSRVDLMHLELPCNT